MVRYKGCYDVDFRHFMTGASFPSEEVKERNRTYRLTDKLFSGEYADNKRLMAMVDGALQNIPYRVIPINMFKLIVNKLDSVLFTNEITVKTGSMELDKTVGDLLERVRWQDKIRQAVRRVEINGDCAIKVWTGGLSVISPLNCIKVVNKHNVEEVQAYVLVEYLYDDTSGAITHIRFEVHQVGVIFEKVYNYSGSEYNGAIGTAVEYEYNGRKISKDGNTYNTGCDTELVRWLNINTDINNGVYGESSLLDIKDLIFALEERFSAEKYVLDGNTNPFLLVGMNMVTTNDEDGSYELKKLNENVLVIDRDGAKPEYLQWTGNLDTSSKWKEEVLDSIYELTEMGKAFLTGEFSGNVSEETFSNMIKGALDRANRTVSEVYYEVRDTVYLLCCLNGIQINKEDITVEWNVGRPDSDKVIAEVMASLNGSKMFSRDTLRTKYYGYNDEQNKLENSKISEEEQSNCTVMQGKENEASIIKAEDSLTDDSTDEVDTKEDKNDTTEEKQTL